jgi:hypothetical protein
MLLAFLNSSLVAAKETFSFFTNNSPSVPEPKTGLNTLFTTAKEVPTSITAPLFVLGALSASALGVYMLYQNRKYSYVNLNQTVNVQPSLRDEPALTHSWRTAKPMPITKNSLEQRSLTSTMKFPNRFDNEAINDLVNMVKKIGYSREWNESKLHSYLQSLDIPVQATESYLNLKQFIEIQISDKRITNSSVSLSTLVGVTYGTYEQLYKDFMNRFNESQLKRNSFITSRVTNRPTKQTVEQIFQGSLDCPQQLDNEAMNELAEAVEKIGFAPRKTDRSGLIIENEWTKERFIDFLKHYIRGEDLQDNAHFIWCVSRITMIHMPQITKHTEFQSPDSKVSPAECDRIYQNLLNRHNNKRSVTNTF